MDLGLTPFPNLILEGKRVLAVNQVEISIPLNSFEGTLVFSSKNRRLIYLGIHKVELQSENNLFGWDNQLFRAIVSSGDLTDIELMGYPKWELFLSEFKLDGKPVTDEIANNFISEELDRVYEKSKGREISRTFEYLKCLPRTELSAVDMRYLFREYI